MRSHCVHLIMVCVVLVVPVSSAFSQTVFSDDFSGGLSSWELGNSQYWSIVNGWLDVDMPTTDYTFAKAFAGDVAWTDYRFEYDLVGLKDSSKICYFRYHDETKGYFLNVRGPVPGEQDPGALRLFELNDLNKWPHGSWTILTKVPFITTLGTTYHVEILVMGPEITVYMNGVETLRYVDLVDPVLAGRIGFAGFTGASFYNHVRWDNVIVRSLAPVPVESKTWGGLKSLFR